MDHMTAARHETMTIRPTTTVLGGLGFMLLAACIVGCSGNSPVGAQKRLPVHKATGTVMYNGEAVEGATVSFHPEDEKNPGAFGKTDSAGKFSIRSYADGPAGAPEGNYVVTVQKSAGGDVPTKSGPEIFKDMERQAQSGKRETEAPPVSFIPEKYARAKTSDLKATITTSGPNDTTYELKN